MRSLKGGGKRERERKAREGDVDGEKGKKPSLLEWPSTKQPNPTQARAKPSRPFSEAEAQERNDALASRAEVLLGRRLWWLSLSLPLAASLGAEDDGQAARWRWGHSADTWLDQ